MHALKLQLIAWVAAPEVEAPEAQDPSPETGATEAATDDAGGETSKPPSPVTSPVDLVKEIELLRTAGALANLTRSAKRSCAW